ncbi:3-isopropylmalate dehydratase large subunit [Patulibacter sp. S7RM1-6]
MGSTITEKILARTAGLDAVRAGEHRPFRPDYMVAYDFPGYTDVMFRQMHEEFGLERFAEPERYLLFIDHMLSRGDAREDEVHDTTRTWAARFGATLHEGVGIGHQATAELGYARPGTFLVHFDGHISGLGAFGALGWGIRRDLLESWVTGQVHLDVPASSRVRLHGAFAPGVDSRDLVHRLIADHGADGFTGQVIEYCGPGAEAMPIDQRQALCGMAMFTGAVSSVFDPDERAIAYARRVTDAPFEPVHADADAAYVLDVAVDLDALEPQVVLPGSARAANTRDIADVAGTPVDRAFIGSCASGRIEDLRAAAALLEGRRVHEDVALHVVPTSKEIEAQARAEGLLDRLAAAGAHVHRSSCDFCFGYAHPLQDGERCVSTGVLNVSGRMGSTGAEIYMGSPYTVAAAALAGRIVDPREVLEDARVHA